MRVTPKLTIGMAVHDDFDGVYFTTQALRLYHAEVMPDCEIVVVDNNPSSAHGQAVKRHVEHFCHVGTAGMQYVAMPESTGTTQPREEVFRRARGEWVLCMDSHVLLEPNSLSRLMGYIAHNPDSSDLLQGPLVYDCLRAISTHFDDVWRSQMWGIWGTDERGKDPFGDPFEIFAQGLGLFAMRKAAWPGFNEHFRQFGGEECYIHEKVRQAGGKCLCLPFLRWNHRFPRPGGASYPHTLQAKVRNYVLGHQELGIPLDRCREHFLSEGMSAAEFDRIAADPVNARVPGMPSRPNESARDRFADLYRKHKSPSGDLLRMLSVGPDHVTAMVSDLSTAVAIASARPRILEIYHPPALGLSPIHETQNASPAFGGRMIQHLSTHKAEGGIPQIAQTDLLVIDPVFRSAIPQQAHRVRGRIALLGKQDGWPGSEWRKIHDAEDMTVYSRIPGDEL